jgi:hypothetical protein
MPNARLHWASRTMRIGVAALFGVSLLLATPAQSIIGCKYYYLGYALPANCPMTGAEGAWLEVCPDFEIIIPTGCCSSA